MSKAIKMDEVEVECKLGTYPNLDDIVVEDDGPTLLLPCIVCNKTFKPEVLQRHSKVCEKNATKKRKTFDSFKQRVQGTDLAEFLPFATLQKRIPVTEKPLSPKKVSSHWKENHEAFVSAIRAARGEEPDAPGGNGDSRSLLRPPDHEQCPYCERNFGKKAFDRHQEWCREHHSRHPPVTASSQAKERLEARIKYRAPPIKSKRALTREKYSPLVQRKVRQVSPSSISNFSSNSMTGSASSSAGSSRHTAQSQQEQSNRLTRSGNSVSGRPLSKDSSGLGFNRGMAGRTSLRASQRAMQRPSSPSKHLPGSGKLPASPTQKLAPEDAPLRNYERDDMTVTSLSLRKSQTKSQALKQLDAKVVDSQKTNLQKRLSQTSNPASNAPTLQIEVNKENSNNAKTSKNEQLWSGNRQEEQYDPYASAERQMMELLRSDSACNINKKQKSPSPAPSISPMPSPTLSPKPSPLETSPTSAFTRYAKEFESALEGQTEIEAKCEEDSKLNEGCGKDGNASLHINSPGSGLRTEVPLSHQSVKPKSLASPAPLPIQPQPPPRSNRRLASLSHSKNNEELHVSGISSSRPSLQSSNSLDAVLVDLNNTSSSDIDNRPKTYDLDSHSKKESQEGNGWHEVNEQLPLRDFEFPTIIDSADGGKIEILSLENRSDQKGRCETRESREIREITEQESNISDIDNLLEQVVLMQRSVSMLSEGSPASSRATPLPANQSSARSRRNRAGKMLIEDFLFPADFERENNNFRSSVDSPDRSNSVFGSTKSRKSSSKGRRLIEDMLFPPGTDLNANMDISEDGDVVVSANALAVIRKSPDVFSPKLDSFVGHCPTSPVALTSKAPNVKDGDDGLPRPKPMSLSAHSSARNGCKEAYDREPTSNPTSPMQPPIQCRQSTSSRLSGDSAYSSLNRRSPVAQARRQCSIGMQDGQRHGAESPQSILSQSLTQSLVLSSSGSESSLPPLSASQPMKRGGRVKHDCDTPSSDIVSATTPLLPKLSKFCHQCGTKFLITLAKFCHECGAPRLEIC